jgi:hypothetical protein
MVAGMSHGAGREIRESTGDGAGDPGREACRALGEA